MRSSNMALMTMNTTEEHGHIGEQGFAISMKEQWQESQKAKLSCSCNGKTLCFIGQTKSYIASFPVNCLNTEWGNILKPNRVATSQLLVVDLYTSEGLSIKKDVQTFCVIKKKNDLFVHTNNTWGVQYCKTWREHVLDAYQYVAPVAITQGYCLFVSLAWALDQSSGVQQCLLTWIDVSDRQVLKRDGKNTTYPLVRRHAYRSLSGGNWNLPSFLHSKARCEIFVLVVMLPHSQCR